MDDTLILSSEMLEKEYYNNVLTPIDDEVNIRVIEVLYDFCCLCGKKIFEHSKKRHKYIAAIDNYRCKKCNLFFFQHNHTSKSCLFSPYKNVI